MQQRRDPGEQWVTAIEQHGHRYRFKMGRRGRKPRTYSFETEDEAKQERKKALAAVGRARAAKAGMTLERALQDYEQYKREEKRNKPRTIEIEIDRLVRFFGRDSGPLPSLTPDTAEDTYRALCKRHTQYGKPPSDAEQQGCLKAARRLGKWLVKRKLWSSNPIAQVEQIGRAKRGEESKPQLTGDQATDFADKALRLALEGDAGGCAVAMALILDLCASEIVSRQKQHLDVGGTVIRVTDGKTENRTRPLAMIGENEHQESWLAPLRQALQIQAQDKLPTAPLIGAGYDRFWVRRQAHRVCKLAGVPTVTAHALRGTHASLAMEQGQSSRAVAMAMGHAGPAVTLRHYASASAVAIGKRKRALGGLGSGTSFHFPDTSQGEEGEVAGS